MAKRNIENVEIIEEKHTRKQRSKIIIDLINDKINVVQAIQTLNLLLQDNPDTIIKKWVNNEPHRVIIKDKLFLVFNYSNEIYVGNLSQKMKLSELENYIKNLD